MEQTIKFWGDLPLQDKETKLKEVGELLKLNGLSKIRPQILDQIILSLKSGTFERQKAIIIEGTINPNQEK